MEIYVMITRRQFVMSTSTSAWAALALGTLGSFGAFEVFEGRTGSLLDRREADGFVFFTQDAHWMLSLGRRSASGFDARALETSPQTPAQRREMLAAEQALQPVVEGCVHAGENRRSGSASRTLARPSQVQRDTNTASTPARR